MARQTVGSYTLPAMDYRAKNWRETAHEKAFTALLEASAKRPKGTLVGAMIALPFADGHAWYRVVKEQPLTLQHVDYGDGWRADAATIRGMRRTDVERMAVDKTYAAAW